MNNILKLTRGDSFEFELTIEDEFEPDGVYRLKDGDAVFFGVMYPNSHFENAIVKKTYIKKDVRESGKINIKLSSSETELIQPGVYYFSIKLLKNAEPEDTVYTLIDKTKFIIFD